MLAFSTTFLSTIVKSAISSIIFTGFSLLFELIIDLSIAIIEPNIPINHSTFLPPKIFKLVKIWSFIIVRIINVINTELINKHHSFNIASKLYF